MDIAYVFPNLFSVLQLCTLGTETIPHYLQNKLKLTSSNRYHNKWCQVASRIQRIYGDPLINKGKILQLSTELLWVRDGVCKPYWYDSRMDSLSINFQAQIIHTLGHAIPRISFALKLNLMLVTAEQALSSFFLLEYKVGNLSIHGAQLSEI